MLAVIFSEGCEKSAYPTKKNHLLPYVVFLSLSVCLMVLARKRICSGGGGFSREMHGDFEGATSLEPVGRPHALSQMVCS
jgi:hypothetical protein